MKLTNSLLVETVRPTLLLAVFFYSISVFIINYGSVMQISDYFYWIVPVLIALYSAKRILNTCGLKYCHECKQDFKVPEKIVTFQDSKYGEVTHIYHSQCKSKTRHAVPEYVRVRFFAHRTFY